MISLIAEPLTGIADTFFIASLGTAPLAGLGVGATLLSSVFWIFNFLGISWWCWQRIGRERLVARS